MGSVLVISQKGGVGKTTSALNLAAAAAQSGRRVLLLDADPIGSVAAALKLSRKGPNAGKNPVTNCGTLWTEPLPGMDVVTPYHDGMHDHEQLADFLHQFENHALRRDYDLVVIDGPPSLGRRTKSLLAACDELVLALRCEPLGYRSLPGYLKVIAQAQKESGRAKFRGLLLTLQPGDTVGGQLEKEIRQKFGAKVLPRTIPYDGAVSRAQLLGRPVVIEDADSPAAQAYRETARALEFTLNDAQPIRTTRRRPARVAASTPAAPVALLEVPAMLPRPEAPPEPAPVVRKKKEKKVVVASDDNDLTFNRLPEIELPPPVRVRWEVPQAALTVLWVIVGFAVGLAACWYFL